MTIRKSCLDNQLPSGLSAGNYLKECLKNQGTQHLSNYESGAIDSHTAEEIYYCAVCAKNDKQVPSGNYVSAFVRSWGNDLVTHLDTNEHGLCKENDPSLAYAFSVKSC